MNERQLHRILPLERDLMVCVCVCLYKSKSEREKRVVSSKSKLIINSVQEQTGNKDERMS